LVGRALFTRHLADRGLLLDEDAHRIAGTTVDELFNKPGSIACTNDSLGKAFNGDLLPLPGDATTRLPSAARTLLGSVLHSASGGQLQLDWFDHWAHLDFACLPVGVLSQAYEHLLRSHQPEKLSRRAGSIRRLPLPR
jgi:hypothetical protein